VRFLQHLALGLCREVVQAEGHQDHIVVCCRVPRVRQEVRMVEAGCCVRRRPAQREPVVRRAWSVVSQLCRAASSSAACTSLSLPYQTLTSTDRCRLHSLGALQRPVADKHRAQPEKSRARDKHTSAQDQGPAWSGCRVRPRVRACSGPRRCSCGAVADLYVTAGAIRSQRRRTRGPVLPHTQEWARCSQVFKPSDTWET